MARPAPLPEDLPQPDRRDGASHPRDTDRLFGQAAAEAGGEPGHGEVGGEEIEGREPGGRGNEKAGGDAAGQEQEGERVGENGAAGAGD